MIKIVSSLVGYVVLESSLIEFQILWGREAPEMKYWLYDKIEVRYNNALTSNSSIKSAFKSRKKHPFV